MSALRKEKPSPEADAAPQKWSGQPVRDDVMDEAGVDPAPRRPPRSVTDTVTTEDIRDPAIDDTYDGEILSSSVGAPVAQPGQGQAAPRPISTQVDSSPAITHFFDEVALRDFRARWDQVQTSFVDEPRHAVELADALVATVVKRIADQFAEERAKLEQQGSRGQNVSTEELRQSFRRYRSFFDRLLAF